MFSFFKRSKSQKGKQKHDQKLQLPPEQQLQPACGVPDGGKPQGTARKESTGSVCLGENDGVKPSADVVVASKVASDANAGANGWRPPAGGDEEKLARAKNNNPPGPQPATGKDWLPSRCLVRGPMLPGGSPGGLVDVALEREPPSAASVSPSGSTCRSGRAPNNDNDNNDGGGGGDPNETRAARDDFPPIDSDEGNEDGAGDRESSSPIDDSRHRERGTQANATSSNPYAPPSESAMAKGKNRRRYQPQQQQQQQQQQQVKTQQQQQQHQQQQQNALRRGDSSGTPEGKKGIPPPTHLSLSKPIATIVLVEQTTIEPLNNGDVIIERSPSEPQKEQAVTEKAEPVPSTDSCDRAAKTHTANGGNGVGALVLPVCADSPPTVTATTGDGVGGTNTRSAPAVHDGDALLNIKNISPTTTGKQQGEDQGGVDGVRDGDHRARELGLVLHAGSCEPAAKPTISKQTTDAVVANGSVEEALVAVVTGEAVADTTIQEMGQQPSRAESEVQQRSSAVRASKSISPQRVVPAAPSPPPRTPRPVVSPADLEVIARNATVTTIERDAAGDDTSDDRDVFYEAKETLSPPIVPPSEPRFESGVVTPGTPEPIRASLVLKIGPEPTAQQQQQQQPVNATPRRADRHKKQVSFKLTQNGSDDVEVTSVDSSASSDEEDGDSDSERERVCAVPPTSTPSEFTNSEFTHHNHTAFSESNNSKPPTTFGICSLGSGEPGGNQRNYIEFKYDNSAPSDTTATAESEKKSPVKDVHEGVGTTTPGGKEKHLVNGEPQQTSVSVLIEDSVASLPDVVQQPTGIEPHGKTILPPTSFSTVEKINSEMKDLVNQECRYSAKLEEAEKRVNEANVKVYELQQKLDAVERDALLKEYNVERLQAELVAALKECEGIRARLTTQQSEMEAIRLQASEREDELNLRYQNLEVEHLELNEKLKEVRHLAHDLNSQLIDAKSEVDRLKEERQKLLDACTEEQKIIRETLEESIQQRAQVEAKWKHDFEQLRNVNNDREEHLMKDCEFTVRNMQKTCKEKVETADRERKQALEKVGRLEEQTRRQSDEMRHLKSVEAEVEQLRGLTYDQKEALASMTRQVEGLKAELETAYNRIEEEMVKVQQIKNRCEYQLCEKEREALNRIEIARGEIAMQWEDRLLHEMNRLKVELEQMHMEERKSAIEKIQRETLAETEALSQRFNAREQQLKNEIESLKATVEQQKSAMANAQSEADQKLVQSRMYVERAEREHEQKLAKEMVEKNEIIDNLKRQFEQEKLSLEQHFTDRIQQVQEEFAREISDTTETMKSVHKKELENQWKALVAEKEKALQLMDSRNRNRLEDAENKIRDLTTGHQRQLKDLQEEHSFVVHSLESRDTKNAQEIQTLHKKCRCLTNLFEEMRLRYERRESRPEDLQQIEELKRVIDSQDRDLRLLTETLRELQLEQMQKQRQQPPQAQQQQQQPPPPPRRSKPNRGKQSKQQQQQNRQQQHKQQQQQKNARPPHPPPEPEPVQPEADEQEDESHEVEEVVGYGQPSAPHGAPQVVLIPPPQFIPPGMMHRTMCDVIYEENEADILREEEEAQLNAGEGEQEEGEEEESDDEEASDVQHEDGVEQKEPEVVIVDVPESAIQTEDRVIQSTAPTIIEEMDPMPEQRADLVGDGIPPFTVVPIETIDNATSARPRASSTPRIVITVDDTEKETGESGDGTGTTVVEITEEPATCVTPVIELPAVFAKIYPSELPTQAAAGDNAQMATHSEPEMTVIRTSEGHGEGSA
ncbi:uncharacterized protein LOC131285405 [Anopheles ziemanni]|uniref:uncharacterized protein LOC131266290 n=1 Tax=Anopheles coustani TaxID=139045 RepID=UPI0026596362|nr:uncharacterized protein LOC131266290 [Anopheles coustani]XP_058170244.1 uncharacterized protein LOC131285405 [Anopheles ziemanni]